MSRRFAASRKATALRPRTLAILRRAIEPLEPRRLLAGVSLIPISGPAIAAEDGSSIARFYLERFDIDPNNPDDLNTLAYTLTGAGNHPADPAEVSLSALQDDLYGPDEELLLTLYDPNDLQTPLASATAIIKSDDGEIWIDGGGAMNESGGQLQFSIHREDLNGAIAFPSTVTIRLKSAGHGDLRASLDDYAVDSLSGAIAEDPETQLFDFTFESWMSSRTLYVNAIDDQLAEGDEWLKIVLVSTDQPNLVLSQTLPTQAFGAIIDDDTPITPPAYLTWLTPAENNNPVEAGSYSFTLHRALEVADYDQLIQIDTTGLDPATLATAYGSGQITLNDTGFSFTLPASQNFFTLQFWLPGNADADPTRPFSFTINPQASTYTTTAPGDLEHPDSLASAIIDDDPAPQPTNLTATPFSDTAVTLNWQDNSPNETGFLIEKSTDGVNWSTVQVLEPDTTTATVDNLDPAIDYAFRLRAENPNASVPSDFTQPLPASTQWQNIGAPLAVPITTTGESPIWLNNGEPLVAGEGYRLVYSSGGVNYSSQSPPNTWTAASYAVRSGDWNYTHWQNEPNGFPFVSTLDQVPSIANDLTWSFTSPGAPMALYFNAGDPQYFTGPGVTWQLQKQIPHVSVNLFNGNHTTEGDTTPLQITLTRDAYFNEPLTVHYTLTPGTADASDILDQFSGTATIAANSFSVDIPLLAADDSTPEWTEDTEFKLLSDDKYLLTPEDTSVRFEVVDNDLTLGFDGANDPNIGKLLSVSADSQRMPLHLKFPAEGRGGASITLESNSNRIAIWQSESSQNLTDRILPGAGSHTWTYGVDSLPPHTLWIEALSGSSALKDVTILFSDTDENSFTPSSNVTSNQRGVVATVAQVKIAREGTDVTAQHGQQIIVGDRVHLTATATPAQLFTNQGTWNIPGNSFSDWTYSGNLGKTEYLTADQLAASQISFAWIDGAEDRQVSFSTSIAGQTIIGSTYFNVFRPVGKITMTNAQSVVFNQTQLSYAERDTDPGAAFTRTVTGMPQNEEWETMWVQIGTTSRERQREDGSWQFKSGAQLNDRMHLESVYEESNSPTTADTPAEGLTGNIRINVRDAFTMTLMFRHLGSASWVPLRSADWFWFAQAQRVGGEWQLIVQEHTVGDPDGGDSLTHPVWSASLLDLNWTSGRTGEFEP